jgi:hypothetical protein
MQVAAGMLLILMSTQFFLFPGFWNVDMMTLGSWDLRFTTFSVGMVTAPYMLICNFFIWFGWPKATDFTTIYKMKTKQSLTEAETVELDNLVETQ